MKVAIIFECLNNFGGPYRFVTVCEDETDVEKKLSEFKSTEIIDYEIVNIY